MSTHKGRVTLLSLPFFLYLGVSSLVPFTPSTLPLSPHMDLVGWTPSGFSSRTVPPVVVLPSVKWGTSAPFRFLALCPVTPSAPFHVLISDPQREGSFSDNTHEGSLYVDLSGYGSNPSHYSTFYFFCSLTSISVERCRGVTQRDGGSVL